jgi:1-acyl-sn-glycerol-3-phosphate acyltransferase
LSNALFANTLAGVARFAAGTQVTWLGEIPQARQTIFFANHTSHLDFVVLWSSLPRAVRAHTRPIAAQDYWSSGMRRRLAVDVFNAILVPRSGHGNGSPGAPDPRDTIDRIAREMGDAYSAIIFPEGTRGTGEAVAPFKSGIYYLCKAKPGVQLVPAFIENLNRILPKGEFVPIPFISRVTFGPPIAFDADEDKAAFLARAHDAVCRIGMR